ncbi:EAL domain-containing protein [Massilia sp. SYSU DXS3249]
MIQRILFLLALSVSLLAHGAAPERVVRVGIYDNAPKVYADAGGRADGIMVELLREVARLEGWELQFVRCQWSHCLAALGDGAIDVLPDVAWTEERTRVFDFPRVPALFSWSQLYRRSGTAIGSVSDLGGKRIAVLSGSIQERYFSEFAGGFGAAPTLVPVMSVPEGFELVRRGWAEAVVASKFVGDVQAPRYGLRETPIMFQPARLFYATGKGRNADLRAALDRRLGAWQADPHSVYFEILDRWSSRSLLARVPPLAWWGAGLVLAMLALALATAAWLRRKVARQGGVLKETEHRLATILDGIDSLVYIKDTGSRYRYANRALHAFLGRAGPDILGRSDAELFASKDADRIARDDRRAMADRTRVVTEETVPDVHGRDVTLLTTKIPLFREDGAVYGMCGISIDISERRAAEEANRVAATVFQSSEGMFIAGPDHRILRVNAAFCGMSGWAPEELIGQPLPPYALSPGGEDAGAPMWAALESGGKWQGEVWSRRKGGEWYPARLTLAEVRDDAGRLTHFVGTQGDISAQKLAQDEIAQLAYFDPLTGLPNRRLLRERLEHCLLQHARSGQLAALLFLDIDNFKDLNDVHGHEAGDQLLRQVGARVSACTRAGDTVARVGGDEFVILLEDVGRDELEASHHAAATGWKIIEAIRAPFDLDGHIHHATCSLGAALGEDTALDMDTLMKRADMALYGAKRDGRDTLRFFQSDMELQVTRRLALESELRAAQDGTGCRLLFQPQVDDSGRIAGAEALLRWNSPSRGPVGPDEFIPVAEASGLIHSMGRWVLRRACEQLASWRRMPGLDRVTMAVNVSTHQFRQPGFAAEVLDIAAEYGIAPSSLKLELTESVLIDDVDDTIGKMLLLKAAGIGFSLDDFGTGYSSLAYLKRLPLDQLKIDRSFVRDILSNPNDAAIARSIVALGQSLGLAIIAEGVETREQRSFLAGIGCACCQGYLFGRPMEASAFEALLHAQSTTAIPADNWADAGTEPGGGGA